MSKRLHDPKISAARIKEARKAKNMTQKKLSDKSEVSLPSIKQYETGKRVPDEKNRKKIAKTLGVYEAWIVGDSDDKDMIDALRHASGNSFNLYEFFFRTAGFTLASGLDIYDKLEYFASYNGERKTFSKQDIEDFYQHIIDYIRSEFQKYISSDYLPENKEDWLAYYKAYPERFETDFIKDNLTNDEIEQLKTEARQDKKK